MYGRNELASSLKFNPLKGIDHVVLSKSFWSLQKIEYCLPPLVEMIHTLDHVRCNISPPFSSHQILHFLNVNGPTTIEFHDGLVEFIPTNLEINRPAII